MSEVHKENKFSMEVNSLCGARIIKIELNSVETAALFLATQSDPDSPLLWQNLKYTSDLNAPYAIKNRPVLAEEFKAEIIKWLSDKYPYKKLEVAFHQVSGKPHPLARNKGLYEVTISGGDDNVRTYLDGIIRIRTAPVRGLPALVERNRARLGALMP